MIKYLLFFAIIFNAIATEKIKDNELKIGKADNQDVKITANNGAANQPYLLYDWSAGTWKQSNDGLTEQGIGGDSVLTTDGDILYYNSGEQRLPKGTDGQFLNLSAGLPAWTTIVTSPITTEGDLQIGDASGDPVRLPIGSATRLLTSNGTTASWELPKDNSVNYFTNPTIEENADDFIVFDDGSFPPIDGTGGTTSVTATRSTTSGTYTPVRETASLLFTKPSGADYTGEGFSTDISVDKGFQGNMATGSVWVLANDTDCVDNAVKITIYDITNTTMERSVSNEGIKCNSLPYIHYFQFPIRSDSTEYRVTFTYDSTDTDEVLYYFDDFKVGVTNKSSGAIVTDWKAYPPTYTNFSIGNGTQNVVYRRLGGEIQIRGFIEFGSTTSITGDLIATIPSGLEMDSSKVNERHYLGNAGFLDSGTDFFDGHTRIRTTLANSNNDFHIRGWDSANGDEILSSTSPFTWATGDQINFNVSAPIEGWGSTAGLSSDLGAQEVTVKGKGNSGGSLTADVTDIDWIETKDTASAWNGSQFTANTTGNYSIAGSVFFTAANSGSVHYFIDGVKGESLGNAITSSNIRTLVGNVYLESGEVLSFRNDVGATLSNAANAHHITITKDASSQTILDDSFLECEKVLLTGDITTDTSVSDFQFPLEIGQKYRVSITAFLNVINGDAGAFINILNSGAYVDRIAAGNRGTGVASFFLNAGGVFTAATTSLTVTTSSFSAGTEMVGSSTDSQSTATLCKLPNSTRIE